MDDVLIVGAGPAGAIAALVLARAGVRVRLLDRAKFPRDKLCGDTINPGTLSILERLGVGDEIARQGLRVDGMILSGEGGVAVEGRYPADVCGRAMIRRELDWILLRHAIAAHCDVEFDAPVQRVGVEGQRPSTKVTGVVVGTNGGSRTIQSRVVIAADGRRSTIVFGLGVARHPARPRRWAVGAYFENFMSDRVSPQYMPNTPSGVRPRYDLEAAFGEMHVRKDCYIGVAAVPGGLTNVCLVKPSGPADGDLRDPAALLIRELARDPMLRDRAAGARVVAPPVVLGPLAVDVDDPALDGLLLAGDASGFIDPMTGDGLRFAVRGGELAAAAALHALDDGWAGVHRRLAAARRREFSGKWRFNRALRSLVGSPRALDVAAAAGRLVPRVFQTVIAHAGDCYL